MRTTIVAVLVAMVMAVSLVGCGGSEQQPPATTPTTMAMPAQP